MNIIFDTNASRKYVERISLDEIEEYAKLNAKKFDENNIKLLLTPIVMMELLYHLVDKNDHDYSISYKAIKCIFLTNKYQDLTLNNLYLPTAELLIAKDLFNESIVLRENMYSSIMHSAKLVAENSILNVPDLTITNGGTIRDYVDEVENGFASQVKGLITNILEKCSSLKEESIVQFINSHHTDFALTLYIARTTYNLLIKENKIPKNYLEVIHPNDPSLQRIKKECGFIANKYPSFLSLFKELTIRVFQSQKQIKTEKIKNYIWDILLMFNVNHLTIQKEKVLFITDDKAMLLSAKNIDQSENIISFDDFRNNYL